ncbi:MAG TPA: 16S rRNA (cytidine(1402)-2'-O)-methyltransferase [Burkholderiaceae bacterium]|nr:16S rRNA (cytidine(1402)-2'-O)-methyltransferase [Burkholderiaceae bacterium]
MSSAQTTPDDAAEDPAAQAAGPGMRLQQLAEHAAGQSWPRGALYVVATPIGNVGDLTLRSLTILQLADTVAAEDTRVAGQLLARIGAKKPLVACDAHRETQVIPQLLARLAAGERVAYVSDAGTPAISDPGARLVDAARAAGHRVVPIPGPSSVAAAVSASGLVDGPFRFAGFAPSKGAERERFFAALQAAAEAQVFFEAPHRMADCAAQLAAAGARRVSVCRELTKQFEQIETLAASALPAWVAAGAHHAQGEFVLVLGPSAAQTDAARTLTMDADTLLARLVPFMPVKEAARLAAELTGEARKVLYERALALRAAASGEGDAPDAPERVDPAGSD